MSPIFSNHTWEWTNISAKQRPCPYPTSMAKPQCWCSSWSPKVPQDRKLPRKNRGAKGWRTRNHGKMWPKRPHCTRQSNKLCQLFRNKQDWPRLSRSTNNTSKPNQCNQTMKDKPLFSNGSVTPWWRETLLCQPIVSQIQSRLHHPNFALGRLALALHLWDVQGTWMAKRMTNLIIAWPQGWAKAHEIEYDEICAVNNKAFTKQRMNKQRNKGWKKQTNNGQFSATEWFAKPHTQYPYSGGGGLSPPLLHCLYVLWKIALVFWRIKKKVASGIAKRKKDIHQTIFSVVPLPNLPLQDTWSLRGLGPITTAISEAMCCF